MDLCNTNKHAEAQKQNKITQKQNITIIKQRIHRSGLKHANKNHETNNQK